MGRASSVACQGASWAPSSAFRRAGLGPPSTRIAPWGPRKRTACPSPTAITIAWGGAFAQTPRAVAAIKAGATRAVMAATRRLPPEGGRAAISRPQAPEWSRDAQSRDFRWGLLGDGLGRTHFPTLSGHAED